MKSLFNIKISKRTIISSDINFSYDKEEGFNLCVSIKNKC